MPSLDFNYVAGLIRKTQSGDGNAFAELFAATYQKQYAFACDFLKDDFKAQQALQETYIYALNNIAKITEASLVTAWLNQIIFRISFRMRAEDENSGKTLTGEFVTVGKHRFSLIQTLTLPFTEAQAIVLRHYCGKKKREVADLLEISRGSVRRYIRSGCGRLVKLTDWGDDA